MSICALRVRRSWQFQGTTEPAFHWSAIFWGQLYILTFMCLCLKVLEPTVWNCPFKWCWRIFCLLMTNCGWIWCFLAYMVSFQMFFFLFFVHPSKRKHADFAQKPTAPFWRHVCQQHTTNTNEPELLTDNTHTLSGCQAGHWAFILMTVRTSSPCRRRDRDERYSWQRKCPGDRDNNADFMNMVES